MNPRRSPSSLQPPVFDKQAGAAVAGTTSAQTAAGAKPTPTHEQMLNQVCANAAFGVFLFSGRYPHHARYVPGGPGRTKVSSAATYVGRDPRDECYDGTDWARTRRDGRYLQEGESVAWRIQYLAAGPAAGSWKYCVDERVGGRAYRRGIVDLSGGAPHARQVS
ncbi:hypothetical protein PG985_008658 [Apiospora marii]|uniref:Chitin-binding type-3 domain-containing protein n=1 Tax=Apiospora marii TaxID=335849 RepID=A0ABR1R3U1_9PEZI